VWGVSCAASGYPELFPLDYLVSSYGVVLQGGNYLVHERMPKYGPSKYRAFEFTVKFACFEGFLIPAAIEIYCFNTDSVRRGRQQRINVLAKLC
jgi:hypothetical protein